MTAARVSLIRGYVLHQRPWRDTSMLVEAFSADAGRVGLVARGVRRRGSRTRPLLEPFQPLLLSWSGRGDLYTLTAVEAEHWRAPPAGPALLAGFYCSELILRLLGREDPNADAFAAYDAALTALATQADTEPTLRRFELALLRALGFAPPLTTDAGTGDPVAPGAEYDYVPDSGPFIAHGPPGEGTLRVPGAHLHALAQDHFGGHFGGHLDDPAVLHSARRLLRACLAPHLGPKPLKSRELYRSMYRSSGSSRTNTNGK